MEIRIGTSGWSYPTGRGTWNGVFYPGKGAGGRGLDELTYYADYFDTVEVNSTFYRQQRPAVTSSWARRTPSGFVFAVKLYQAFTHGRRSGPRLPATAPTIDPDDVAQFRASIAPLAEAGKLGPILAQFPASYQHGAAAIDHLDSLLRTLDDLPIAVDLRHRSWSDHHATTSALLQAHGAAWVEIDEPQFASSIQRPPANDASDFGYTRFHGRNAEAWWRPPVAEDRYDYLYSRAELAPFATAARSSGGRMKKRYLYLNNHFAAKAVANATILKHELDLPVAEAYPAALVTRYPELADFVRVEAPPLPGTA